MAAALALVFFAELSAFDGPRPLGRGLSHTGLGVGTGTCLVDDEGHGAWVGILGVGN